MPDATHPHARLIRRLGGPAAAAIAILADRRGGDLNHRQVWKWTRRGVPWRWRPRFAAALDRRGFPIPRGFLADG